MKKSKEDVLKGQRNRAYAGLHSERERANRLEKANVIMGIVSFILVIIALIPTEDK